MSYALTIRLQQAADSLVVLDCSERILSRERMLTRSGNKSDDKKEVAGLPNSHSECSMNGARQQYTCDICPKDAR